MCFLLAEVWVMFDEIVRELAHGVEVTDLVNFRPFSTLCGQIGEKKRCRV